MNISLAFTEYPGSGSNVLLVTAVWLVGNCHPQSSWIQ